MRNILKYGNLMSLLVQKYLMPAKLCYLFFSYLFIDSTKEIGINNVVLQPAASNKVPEDIVLNVFLFFLPRYLLCVDTILAQPWS